MSEIDDSVTKLFMKDSRHYNVSVMIMVQNLFGKNKEQRTISLNCYYRIFFKNRETPRRLFLVKQMYPGRTSYVQDSFKDATAAPLG